MQIRTAFLPQLAGDVSEAVCIVIDVLRATSVIATLFERGCPRVYVAGTHEKAQTFARGEGYVLCGESGGVKVVGFDYGNSPTEFDAEDFTDRPVVLSTTNGTKAALAIADAKAVYFGAALNCHAVAGAAYEAAEASDCDIVIVCSGTEGRFTLEDATVAGIYVEALNALGTGWKIPKFSDDSIAARRLWEKEPNLLRGWMEGNHAQTLADLGFGADLGFCAAVDTLANVPTLTTETGAAEIAAPVLLVR